MFKSVVILILILALSIPALAGRDEDFRFAQKLYTDGYFDLAAKQFAKFIDNYPDDQRIPSAYFIQGKSLFTLEDWDGARTAFIRVALEYSENKYAAEALYNSAQCLRNKGKWEDSARSFLGVSDYYPRSEFAAKGMVEAGIIYRRLGNDFQAEVAFNRIISDFRGTASSALAYLNLAELSEKQNDTGKALQYYLIAGEVSEDETIAAITKIRRSMIFQRTGDWLKAESEIENVKSPLEYFNYARMLKGLWLQKQGDFAGAEKLLRTSVSSSKQDTLRTVAELYLADNYYLKGEFTYALDIYRRQAESDTLLLRLGLTYQRLKHVDEAVQSYAKVLESQGDYRTKALALESLKELYTSSRNKGSISNILSGYLAGLTELPFWEDFSGNMGILALEEQNWDLAEKFFLKLKNTRSLWPDDALFYLAEIAVKKDRKQEAISLLEELIDKYPGGDYSYQAGLLLLELKAALPPENLVDEVARLSASTIEFNSRGEIALNWGKAYYESFKDNPKACAQLKSAYLSGDLTKDQRGEALGYLTEALLKRVPREPALSDSAVSVMRLYLRNHPDGKFAGIFTFRQLKNQVATITDSIRSENALIEGLEEIVYRYPDDDALPQVMSELIDIYARDLSRARKAVQYSEQLEQKFPDNPYFESALADRIQARILLGELDLAKRDLFWYREKFPHGFGLFQVEKDIAQLKQYPAEKITAVEEIVDRFYYCNRISETIEDLGDLYMESGDIARALEKYLAIIKRSEFTQQTKTIEIEYKIGRAFHLLGDYKNAQEYFLGYAVNNPNGEYWGEAIYALGAISEEENRAPTALKFYENLLGRSAGHNRSKSAQERMAAIYYQIERYADGRKLYLQLAGNSDTLSEEIDYTAKAIIGLYKQGLLESAKDEAVDFAAKYKKHPELKNYLALFYLEKSRAQAEEKNFSAALKSIDTIFRRYDKTDVMPEAEYELGRIYLITNRYDQALAALTAIPDKYPGHEILPSVYVTLGTFYYRQKQYQNALLSFQKVLDDTQAKALWQQAMSNLEVTYRDLGLWEAAYSIVNRYLETFPFSDDLISKKLDAAQLLIRMREYDRAIERLSALLSQVNEDMRVEVQFYLGDAYFQQGDFQQAVLEFMKVKYLDPGGGLDWSVTAIYNAGKCYEKLGNLNEARNMYNEIIQRWGADSDYGRGAQQRIEFLNQLEN